jgi:hypothetical protein
VQSVPTLTSCESCCGAAVFGVWRLVVAEVSGQLTDRIGLGVLIWVVDRDLVDEVLAETERREKRRRLLAAWVWRISCWR